MTQEYETAMVTRADAIANSMYDRELERERDFWDSLDFLSVEEYTTCNSVA